MQKNSKIMNGVKPYYKTDFGKAFNGDTLKLIQHIPDNSLDLIVTSPLMACVQKRNMETQMRKFM